MSSFPHWLLAILLLVGLLYANPIKSQASQQQPNVIQAYHIGQIDYLYRHTTRF